MSIATDTRVQHLEEAMVKLQSTVSHLLGILSSLEQRLAALEAAAAEQPQASKDGRRR